MELYKGPWCSCFGRSASGVACGAQVSAYAFTFPDEASDDGKQIRIMLPLLDLLNHGNEGVAALLYWPVTGLHKLACMATRLLMSALTAGYLHSCTI